MAEEKEVAKIGRTFRGVVTPTGPGGNPKTVNMYLAVATKTGNHDEDILTPGCVNLRELREAIDKLKDDLEWVYKGMEKKLTKLREKTRKKI